MGERWDKFWEVFADSEHRAWMSKMSREPLDLMPNAVKKVGKSTAETFGSMKGDWLGTTAKGGSKYIGKPLKIAAIGAAVVGGLAYLSSTGRKSVTPESVANDSLEPEDFAEITPIVPEGPVLPPINSETMLANNPMAEGKEPDYWQNRVRDGMGMDGPEKLASAPRPRIAEDMRVDHVSTEPSFSLGA